MGMKCDFDYCLYNKDFTCILDEIEMNSTGQCDACMLVSFPEEKLAEYKKNQLQEIMRRYEDAEK